MFVGIGMVLLPVAVFTYWRLNAAKAVRRRDAEETGVNYQPEELRRMGDRSPDFRYTL